MPDASASSGVPQFGKAEYSASREPGRCELCQQPLGSSYYRVKGAAACEACALKAKSEEPADTHSAFARALVYGIAGAILGLIVYSVFTIVTGIEIGIVSIAVGYLVGKAMKMGSRGSGGRKYQIAALVLTYAAVSLAAIPISIAQYMKGRESRAQVTQSSQSPSSATAQPAPAIADSGAAADGRRPGAPPPLSVLGPLIVLGLASPFLDLQQDVTQGAIGLLILFVGMRFAWQLTAGSEVAAVVGPFANRSAPTPPPAPL